MYVRCVLGEGANGLYVCMPACFGSRMKNSFSFGFESYAVSFIHKYCWRTCYFVCKLIVHALQEQWSVASVSFYIFFHGKWSHLVFFPPFYFFLFFWGGVSHEIYFYVYTRQWQPDKKIMTGVSTAPKFFPRLCYCPDTQSIRYFAPLESMHSSLWVPSQNWLLSSLRE